MEFTFKRVVTRILVVAAILILSVTNVSGAPSGTNDVQQVKNSKTSDLKPRTGSKNEDLWRAVARGDVKAAKGLLGAGANPNIYDSYGRTALIVAAGNGDSEMVRLLLDKGADINRKANRRLTALVAAIVGGHPGAARVLLDKGAGFKAKTKDGGEVLVLAAITGEIKLLKMLLEAGIDVNARSNDDSTALMSAALGGHSGAMKVLLDKGADVNARTKGDRLTALTSASIGFDPAALKADLAKKVGLEVDGNRATGAPKFLVGKGHLEAVRLLLDKGADVNAKTKDGLTAMRVAQKQGYEEIVKLLKAYGARE